MNDSWRNGFSNIVASRGISYYRSGKVRDLETHSIDDMVYFTARVEGTEVYTVSGQYISGRAMNLSCSCPYEYKCKHMYAVLCAVDDKYRAEDVVSDLKRQARKISDKARIYPFTTEEDSPSGYRYFDFPAITSEYYITQENYDKACRLISDMKTEPYIKVGPLEGEDDGSICHVRLAFGDRYDRSRCVELYFSRDRILSSQCGDYSCFSLELSPRSHRRNELCPHKLACLILAEKFIRTRDLGDSTNYEGMELVRSLIPDPSSAGHEGSEAREFSLVPRLSCREGSLLAGFRVGFEKKYVVRNLSFLVEKFRSGGAYPLGKSSAIDFSSAVPDPVSALLMRLICREADQQKHLAEEVSYYDARASRSSLGAEMPLFGNSLDDFYQALEGEKIEFRDEDREDWQPALLTDRDPLPCLTLEKALDSRGGFDGVRLTGSLPTFISGEEGSYYIDRESPDGIAFCRLSPDLAKKWKRFPASMKYGGDMGVYIGRRVLPEFYRTALPALKDCFRILEPDMDLIESYLPPEPHITFYLDTEDGLPFCRGEAAYGDSVFSVIDAISQDRPFVSMRSSSLESAAASRMVEYFPEPGPDDIFRCPDDNEAIFRLLEKGMEHLRQLGEVRCTDSFQNLMVHRTASIRIGITAESDLLNLTVSSDISPQELLEVLRSYKLKKRFHRLKNGSFIDINAVVADLSDMLDSLHISPREFCSGNMNIPAYRALYLDRMLDEDPELQSDRDSRFRSLVRSYKTVADSDFEIPPDLKNVLRPYQAYGYRWLRTLKECHFGGILADDMGLGKTLQTIALLEACLEPCGGTALIVCPSSLVYNWMDEFARFSPGMRCAAVAGPAEERGQILASYGNYDVLVTSYDTLKRDIAAYEDCRFAFEILDEAQYIKNHATVAAKSVKLIRSSHRFALTGTPIENRLSELWSIFDFLMPGFLYGYDTFKKEMETPIVRHGDREVSARLRRMVSPFILRRLKTDVLKDLPDKIEETCFIRLDPEQQKLYDGQVVRIRRMLSSSLQSAQHRMAILAELTKIRQICCDPSLLFEDYRETSAKRAACLELVRSAMEGGHRVLLFSQFTSMLDLLEEDLKKEEIAFFKITGATPKGERIRLVNEFNAGDTPLFLISLKAGGTGLNLTGADTVIHYDPWWNVAAMNQATDRAHRIGQDKVVSVYKMIAKGTIEEKILEMQKTKKALADDILNENTANFMTMSSEELLEILS